MVLALDNGDDFFLVLKYLYLFRDILRSMKEGMKSFKEKRAPSIRGGKEAALRNETEIMQEFKKTVDDAWKWVSRFDTIGLFLLMLGVVSHTTALSMCSFLA